MAAHFFMCWQIKIYLYDKNEIFDTFQNSEIRHSGYYLIYNISGDPRNGLYGLFDMI